MEEKIERITHELKTERNKLRQQEKDEWSDKGFQIKLTTQINKLNRVIFDLVGIKKYYLA